MRDPTLETERRLLAALCQGFEKAATGAALTGYGWREPLHQALFSALMEIPSDNPAVIRGELPARLVRKGFPDCDWESFFRAPLATREETLRLVRQLGGSR